MPQQIVHIPHTPSSALVKQSRFFQQLPPQLLTDMATKFRLEEWPKGVVVEPELLLQRFHIVLDGELEFRRSNPETGREITLDLMYPGDSFDVICLLDAKPHNAIISPLTMLRLISVPIETMRQWLWTYPELNQQFLPYLARKMREQEDLTTSVALHDVSARLARILLKHIDRINAYTGKKNVEHQTHLINGLSDDVLARMVGSVRQVVNKHLQHWKSQGLINKKRNQLMINDLEALKKEVEKTSSGLATN